MAIEYLFMLEVEYNGRWMNIDTMGVALDGDLYHQYIGRAFKSDIGSMEKNYDCDRIEFSELSTETQMILAHEFQHIIVDQGLDKAVEIAAEGEYLVIEDIETIREAIRKNTEFECYINQSEKRKVIKDNLKVPEDFLITQEYMRLPSFVKERYEKFIISIPWNGEQPLFKLLDNVERVYTEFCESKENARSYLDYPDTSDLKFRLIVIKV